MEKQEKKTDNTTEEAGVSLKIILVDDHDLTREALRELVVAHPGWEVVAEADSGEGAVEKTNRFSPDVVVMDMQMPGMSGIDATRKITADQPSTRILIASNYVAPSLVKAVLKAGAAGYIHKHSAYEELVSGIEAVASGRPYVCGRVKQQISLFG